MSLINFYLSLYLEPYIEVPCAQACTRRERHGRHHRHDLRSGILGPGTLPCTFLDPRLVGDPHPPAAWMRYGGTWGQRPELTFDPSVIFPSSTTVLPSARAIDGAWLHSRFLANDLFSTCSVPVCLAPPCHRYSVLLPATAIKLVRHHQLPAAPSASLIAYFDPALVLHRRSTRKA